MNQMKSHNDEEFQFNSTQYTMMHISNASVDY